MDYKSLLRPVLLVLILVCALSSCKTAAKRVAREISEDAISESTEKMAKTAGREVAENLGERVVRKMKWDDLISILKKETPGLISSLSHFNKGARKALLHSLNTDDVFFETLKSSRTLLDEYVLYVKDAPRLMENSDFLRYFARVTEDARLAKASSIFDRIAVKESKGAVALVSRSTGDEIARLSAGILNFSRVEKLLPADFLKTARIPNTLYKYSGVDGLQYLISIDELGRISKVNAKNVSLDDLVENILKGDKNLNLGSEWNAAYRSLKQASRGDDCAVSMIFRYADDGTIPQNLHIDASAGSSRITKSLANITSAASDEVLLKRYAKIFGMDNVKLNTLLREMSADEGLARLVRNEPELNIRRWLNTRNHVDKSLLAVTPKGEFPKNAQVYAGNVYYFNPHLNSALNARLKTKGAVNLRGMGTLSYNDLIALDRMYPEGVPFSKAGFPDFSKVAAKGADGKPISVDIGILSGDSKKDIARAETLFQQQGNKWQAGFTWHHVENTTTLLRVPTNIHQMIDHTGAVSMNRIQ